MITAATTMHAIFQYVEAVALSQRPVMITGETGVDKELMARAAHSVSRRQGAFVPVNVAEPGNIAAGTQQTSS